MATVHKATGALVVVRDTAGVMHYFQRGQTISVDASSDELKRLRDKGLLEKVKVEEPAPADPPPPDPETLPASSATRAEWDAYAVKVGVDPTQFSKLRPDLVDAVTAAHEAKVKADEKARKDAEAAAAAAGSGDGGSGS
jgi:hypothetical protein